MLTILAIFLILLFSGLFSGSETALYSTNKAKAVKLAEEGSQSGKILLKIKSNMQKYIGSIVFANNAVNIFGTAIVTALAMREFGEHSVAIVTFALTILIIIFAEIIPKNIGEARSLAIAQKVAIPIYTLSIILFPILYVIDHVVVFCMKLIDKYIFKGVKNNDIVDEAEILATARMSKDHEQGGIDEEDYKQINGIFKLDDICVEEIMTPASQISSIRFGTKIKDNIDYICNSQHSRILIIDNHDDVKGYLLSKNALALLVQDKETDVLVEDIMFQIGTCQEKDIVDDVFEQLKEINDIKGISSQQYISVVKNRHNSLVGVITVEDIQEEVFGQFYDETDKHIDLRVVAKSEVINSIQK
jgi:CBS domain containing-hemolysin-like protein